MTEEEAKEEFRKALERFRDRDYSGAIQIWRRLQKEGFQFHNLELYLAVARREQARVLQIAEDYGSTFDEASDAAAVEVVEGPEARARKHLAEKRYAEASRDLEEALRQPDADPFKLRLVLAQVQLLLGHFQDALFHLEQARLVTEDSSRLFSTFGAVLRELGRPLEAEREYRRAVDLDSRDSSAWFGLARLYYEDERLDMTESCLQKVLSLRPGAIHATTLLDEVRRRQEQTRTLIDEGLEILGENPQYPDWHHRVAVHYSYTGDYERARRHLKEALKLNPRLGKSAYQLGMLEAQTGNFPEACEAFRKCLATQEGEEAPEHRVAASLEKAGRYEEAAYEYSVSVAPRENRAGRHIDLGKRLFAESFLPQARRELERAIELQPSYPDARYVLARVAFEEGSYDEAQVQFKKALDLYPYYQAAALGLARSELVLGNVAAAGELVKQYGEDPRPDLKPGWDEVRQEVSRAGA